MSPAPRTRHQGALSYLHWKLNNHVRPRKLGRVYSAPIDVILPRLASPVQPDVLLVDRKRVSIVKEKFIRGAPDLVMEILSPTNPSHDRKRKFKLYAEAGVREYWIVDLKARTIEVFVLAGQRFQLHGRFKDGDAATSKFLADFQVPVTEVCDEA